ncbi:MAG TPA: EF-hand domain-containing protein [Lysobacter sp.]
MKQKTLPILTVVLATAVLAVACKKPEETPAAIPPAATEPAPAPAVTEPVPVPAPETPPPATATDSGMSFDDMDKNKDGGITKDELADTEMLSQHFAAADKDGDGKLSKPEVDAHRAEMAAPPGG